MTSRELRQHVTISLTALVHCANSFQLIPDPMDEASDYTVHTIGSGIRPATRYLTWYRHICALALV